MRYIFFVFLFSPLLSLAQETIAIPEGMRAADSNGNDLELTIRVISREEAERRRDRQIQNYPPEVDVTYGLDSPEDEAIRMLFLDPQNRNGFVEFVQDDSERLIIMTASAIILNDDPVMEELANYCGWLLNDEISKTPRDAAIQFSSIDERASVRILDEYRNMLSRLSNDTASLIESRKQAIHETMQSQKLNVLTLFEQDPNAFLDNWRNRCETRF